MPELLVQYRDGRRFRIPAHDPDYAAAFFHGEYEHAESSVVRALLRRGDFAIDVGANLGWYSILMSASVRPNGAVWAFEPVADTRELLEANLALNADHLVEVRAAALASAAGTIEVHTFRGLPHGHASISRLGRDDFTSHEVCAETLDRLLDRAELQPPVLVKLDAEGAELEILRGASRTCASGAAPIWMIEVNRAAAAACGYEPAALAQQLREFNEYQVYRVVAGGLAVERELEKAHGVTWTFVPPNLEDRAQDCTIAH